MELRNGIEGQWLECTKGLMADGDRRNGATHHSPVGKTVNPYLFRGFCQRREEYLQVYHIASFRLECEVLAVSIGFSSADTVLCARLLIYDTRLFRGQPHISHLIGRHLEVAV